mmetsp:Transcript_27294/g.38403  ORF Transcript_27294/g.38403 Transcript_27294/m.38403 type:complete len:106 (-) Transcript_27294:140-457(-)
MHWGFRMNPDGNLTVLMVMRSIEEETLLQHMAKKMGAVVDRTPECHCEMAREGTECSWGCLKNHCRRFPISFKKNKANFRKLVREECCSKDILTKERVGKISKRA